MFNVYNVLGLTLFSSEILFLVILTEQCCDWFTKLVDKRGRVIPDPTVETGRVVPHLIQDLIHLKGGQHTFYQHSGFNTAYRKAKLRRTKHKHTDSYLYTHVCTGTLSLFFQNSMIH